MDVVYYVYGEWEKRGENCVWHVENVKVIIGRSKIRKPLSQTVYIQLWEIVYENQYSFEDSLSGKPKFI